MTAADHTPAYEPVDLSTCDREPIHIPGAIQPHGVLLAVDADLRVTTASANAATLLGRPPTALVGLSLAEVLGEQAAGLVAEAPSEGTEQDLFTVRLPRDLPGLTGTLAGVRVDVRTHRSGNRLVVELEDLDPSVVAGMSLRSARRAIGRLASRRSVTGLADQLVTEIRALLGFDRVMVYRFDAEWNGEVIAEEHLEGLNSFYGLHYPATDIPAQARRLYTENWTRLIPDINYEPVPLNPILELDTGAPLDLSFSSLRSVSPIHIEYLSHMGVTASMSVSIVIDGKLWGLVACHHYSGPLRPTYDARSAAELLGQVASQMFFDREQAELRHAALSLGERVAALLQRAESSEQDIVSAVFADPELAVLFGATGVAVSNGDQRISVGTVPPWDVMMRIGELLYTGDEYAVGADDLATLDPELAAYTELCAGALRIGSAPASWIIWFRPELVQTVDWGGDPTNKLLAQQEGAEVRLSPRRSFEKWQQVVQGRSRPWEPAELESATTLGLRLQTLILAQSREQVAMVESLQRSVVPDAAPVLDGIEVAARYLPASTAQLGGDWWDAFELGDGRTAFVVGDVAGHGVRAASVMVQVRTSLRAYLFEGHEPMDCLNRLDDFIDSLLAEQIVTAVIVVVDRVARTASIAAAGHPPVVRSSATTSEPVTVSTRPVLGVALRIPKQATVIDLAPGDALLLYTDGLIERRGESFDTSLARLAAPAVAVGNSSLGEWLDRLVAHVGADQGDDTTLLALRVTGG